jgi:hypothetical protein
MSTISKTFRVGGVLTDMTSVKLSDVTAAFGVKRNDTDAVVVADNTALTHVSTGVYSYGFTDPAYDLSYTVALEVVYSQETHHLQWILAGPATPGSGTSGAAPTWDTTTLSENAAAPAVMEEDGVRMEQHSLRDQIEMDRYSKSATAAGRSSTGLRFFQIVPPGGGGMD